MQARFLLHFPRQAVLRVHQPILPKSPPAILRVPARCFPFPVPAFPPAARQVLLSAAQRGFLPASPWVLLQVLPWVVLSAVQPVLP